MSDRHFPLLPDRYSGNLLHQELVDRQARGNDLLWQYISRVESEFENFVTVTRAKRILADFSHDELADLYMVSSTTYVVETTYKSEKSRKYWSMLMESLLGAIEKILN